MQNRDQRSNRTKNAGDQEGESEDVNIVLGVEYVRGGVLESGCRIVVLNSVSRERLLI